MSAALGQTLVAAGGVVASALQRRVIKVHVVPPESFFLKPLTAALEEALGARIP